MLASRRIRAYDFRRPDKFSKDHLRALELLFGHLARLTTSFLVAHLRTTVTVTVDSVSQESFGEFMEGMGAIATIGVGTLGPLPGKFCIYIAPDLTFRIVDQMFGGHGSGAVKARALTEIEQQVMERILLGFLQNLTEAFRGTVDGLMPRLDNIESNPLFAQIAAPSDMAVTIGLEVAIGKSRGAVRFCLPYVLLEPILPRFSLYQQGKVAANADAAGELEQSLKDVPVDVVAELGRTQLTIRDLLGLEAGDVVPLSSRHDRDILVRVGNRSKFRGRIGQVGRLVAVRIHDVWERQGEGDFGHGG